MIYSKAIQTMDLGKSIETNITVWGPEIGGVETANKVFLLTGQEIFEYFTTASARQCKYIDRSNNGSYWCRLSRNHGLNAQYIWSDGSGNPEHEMEGYPVYNGAAGVRPAMWIYV